MEKLQRNNNCIEYFETKHEVESKQSEQDKDLIIADLTTQLATTQQQINDMSMIVADLQTKIGGTV